MERTFRRVYKTLILAAGFFLFAGCSSDDNENPDTGKSLPTFGNLTVRVGDAGTLTFDAYGTWTLSSNKPWFKLQTETGVAGSQSVGYNVTDDALGFEDDQATVTFAIGTKSTSFTATRTAKERTLKLYTKIYDDQTGEWSYDEVESIDLAYAANAATYNANFAVVANFDWKISAPAWISIEEDYRSGDANPDAEPSELVYQWISVDYTAATGDDMSGELTFADHAAADKTFVKRVTCPGAKHYMLTEAAYTVTLNAEGKYIHSGFVDGEYMEEIVEDAYPFTAKAGYDGVVFFKLWKDGNWYGVDETGMGNYEYDAKWCGIDVVDTKTLGPGVKEYSYELWANPNDGSVRTATILGLPDALAAGLTAEDLVNSDGSAIKDEYQSFVITDLEQTGASGGLEFEYGQYIYDITLEKMAEGDELDGIKSNWGVESVYVLTYDGFDSATMASMKLIGYTGEELIAIIDPEDAKLVDNGETGSGWIGFSPNNGTMMTADIMDRFVPFTAPRSALVVLQDKETGMNQVAIKVVQNVARGEE